MKTKLTIGLFLLAFILAACGAQATQPAAPAPAEVMPTLMIPTLTAPAPVETAAPAAEAPAVSSASFVNDVAPILAASCNNCHGGNQTKAGLDLTTYDGLMAGSFDGAVIVPGNAADSILVQQVMNGEMPKRGDKLTPEQIQVISDWVAADAPNN